MKKWEKLLNRGGKFKMTMSTKCVPIILQLVIALIYVEFQRYFLKAMKTLFQMISQLLDVHERDKIVMVHQLSHHQTKDHEILLEMVLTVMML